MTESQIEQAARALRDGLFPEKSTDYNWNIGARDYWLRDFKRVQFCLRAAGFQIQPIPPKDL